MTWPGKTSLAWTWTAVALQVRAGEVVGIAGVSGNGQKELLYALSGEDTRAAAGAITVKGQGAGTMQPGAAAQAGPAFCARGAPGARRGADAAAGAQPAAHAQGSGGRRRLDQRRASCRRRPRQIIERFKVKCGGPQAVAKSLSGGNLQKFIMGREIDAGPALLIVSQPTWGVDVGAASQIRGEMLKLARRRLRGAGGQRRTGRTV